MSNFFHDWYIRTIYLFKYKWKYRKEGKPEPWAIILETRSKRKTKQAEDGFNQFLNFASRKIRPNRKQLAELINYMETKFGAVGYTIDPRTFRIDLFNLVKNDYAHIFDDPLLNDFDFMDIIKERTQRSIDAQRRVDYFFEKVKDHKLNVVYYRFIVNPESLTEEHKYLKVGIETTSGKLLMGGPGETSREIIEEITLYYGVSEHDIRHRTHTFIAYAIYLRDRGMLVP